MAVELDRENSLLHMEGTFQNRWHYTKEIILLLPVECVDFT